MTSRSDLINEMVLNMSKAAAVVKLICGVGNNAAWLVALDGYDHARRCKRYGNGLVKHEFRQVIKMFHDYERTLIYATENRMFHLADMTPNIRKKFGDISDRQYYEFWAGMGSVAYRNTRPLLTSLANKYRLSLQVHGAKDAEDVAWVMTAAACLELSVSLYNKAIEECITSYKLPATIVRKVFRQFSLEAITKKWRSALDELAPDTDYELESTEQKNIEHGLLQLYEAWSNTTLLYESSQGIVEDYEEVFRTPGERKKAAREIAEAAETIRNYERE
jgi:hypothetical protein